VDDAFRLLVSGVKEYAIFMLDMSGAIVSWNEGAERIKGYRESEIIGEHFSVFYDQQEIDAGKPEWELLVAERDGHFEDEGWRLRKDGTRFWASVIITALRDESGELRGFGKVTRDITDRKLAAERLAGQQRREAEKLREDAKRLSHLERTKSEFLNVASHELRGPIAVLRGYLSMLEDGTISPDELPRIMPMLSGKLQQMELLVQQMLETARLEASRFELHTEQVDVCRLAERVVGNYRAFAQDTHAVTLSRPEEPIVVSGDPRRLDTVLSNLIDNAIKYSPQGGPVRCLVARTRGRVFLSVEDAGLGISAEAMDRLFTRFGRIVTPENAHIDGTGLGLYLAREIARHHGGDILVESREGRGSRFTLTLPVQFGQPSPGGGGQAGDRPRTGLTVLPPPRPSPMRGGRP
jgi:PAS domain S-box-containing protein